MKPPADLRPIEMLVTYDRPVDPEVAEQVGQEIIRSEFEPGAWATALAASGGKREEALATYARIRMPQVTAQRCRRRVKAQLLEVRRLHTCLGIKTVRDLLNRSNRGGQLNLIKPQISIGWLSILLVGSAGAVASMGRLLGDRVPDRVENWIPAMALICGALAVGGVLMLRALLPRRWIMLGWNTALTGICSAACFASLCFGAKLISLTSPEVIQKIAAGPTAEAAPVPPAELSRHRPAPLMVKPSLASTAALEEKAGEE